MSDLNNYLSAKQYSEEVNVTVPTLAKWSTGAIGTPYALGPEDAKYGTVRVWHRSKWMRLQSGRLLPAIEEAVRLGMVVKFDDHKQAIKEEWESGYRAGQDAHASAASIGEAETTGLTYGGFQPIGSM